VGLLTNPGGMSLVIGYDRLYERSATPVHYPIIQTKLVTARVELATATLRNELLRHEIMLKKKDQPPTPIVPIIEQPTKMGERAEPGAPTVPRSEPTR